MITGANLLKEAADHLGDEYEYGADVPLEQGDDYHGETDCAEFVTEVVHEKTGKIYGALRPDSDNPDPWTGAWYADMVSGKVTEIPVSRAKKTPGAILWRKGHIAFSDGVGGTVEAMGEKWGVVRGKAGNRFTHGILIPNVCYEEI